MFNISNKSEELYNLAKEICNLDANNPLLQEKTDELRNLIKESTDSEKYDALKTILDKLGAKVDGSRFENPMYVQGFRSTDPDSGLYHGYKVSDYQTPERDISFDTLINIFKMLLKYGVNINDCYGRYKHVERISRIIGSNFARYETFEVDASKVDSSTYNCNIIAKQKHEYKSQIFYVLSNHYYKLNNESKNVIRENKSLHNHFKIHEKVNQKLSSDFPTIYKILSECNERSKDALTSLRNEETKNQLKHQFKKYKKEHGSLCNSLIVSHSFIKFYAFCTLVMFYFIIDFPIIATCLFAVVVLPGTYYFYSLYKSYGFLDIIAPAPFPLPDELKNHISISVEQIKQAEELENNFDQEDLQNITVASLVNAVNIDEIFNNVGR